MFQSINPNKQKDDFLKQAEEARIKRQQDKQRNKCAIQIQSYYRGYKVRSVIRNQFRNDVEHLFDFSQNKELTKSDLKVSPVNVYTLIQKYFFIEKQDKNRVLFDNICKYINHSILNGELKYSYISLVVSKDNYQNVLTQSKKLLKRCIDLMSKLNVRDIEDVKSLNVYLNLIVTFTTYQMWKGFQITNNELLEKALNEISKSYLIQIGKLNIYEVFHKILLQSLLSYKPILKPTITATIVTLSLRILQINNYSHQNLNSFCSYILINPALIKYLNENCSLEIIQQLKEYDICNRIYTILSVTESINKFLEDKDLNQSISFLGNLCSLAKIDLIGLKLNVEVFITLCTVIFEHCCDIVNKSKGQNNTIWHPFVGYLSNKSLTNHSEALLNIFDQLKFLWNHQFITILFDSTSPSVDNVTKANFKGLIKGMFDKALKKEVKNQLSAQESSSIFRICTFYRKLLFLFSEPKMEILSALSIEEELILGLWRFLCNLGPLCGLKDLVKLLEIDRKFTHSIFDVLYLLTSLTQYLVTIFDEYEFYDRQQVFRLDDYKTFALFLNNFLYKIILNELIDLKNLEQNNYFCIFHQLLTVLHDKDSQRMFTSNNDFWVIKDLKIKSLLSDVEKEKLTAVTILNKIPHIIPHKTRVEILQNIVSKDKLKIFGEDNVSQIRIKIRRSRVVEDGYQQLANLPTNMFKSTIRVVFVNEYGLNEAGIDQDGVFKEFLQEILKKILNPEFNLFRATDEQQLYPSPSSYYVDDHLKLFEFVGKVFAKAVYEGIVVDVQFAPFFLRQLLGYRYQNYSFFDDLASLDRDLYKNLSLIKREMDEETVSSLELTFTYSESHLGSLVTHDLVPSGSFIKVNSENKIKYIHLLALFKLHKQIKKQVMAFNEGFKSIIKQDWLNMFSIPEIQKLISGSCQDIDFEDLKKNVQYWGGLHSNHRLIKWLWEILENDFNREERGLFLKFVTSCSKPPLLGFSTLNPPFTIRCVEVEEAEGTIYDASLTGFFKTIMNLSNKDTSRLPTSSTCFNLLKLPNYSKKSTLRDKLRYAIRSNAGFELS